MIGIVGIAHQPVKEITLGGRPGGTRQGHVIEKKGLVTYRWTDMSQLWAKPNLVTGRRKFSRKYGKLVKRTSEGSVICRSNFLGEGPVVLYAEPNSAVGSLGFGTELHGIANPVEVINCHTRIQVSIE